MGDVAVVSHIMLWVLALSLLGVHMTTKRNVQKHRLGLQNYGLSLMEAFPSVHPVSISGTDYDQLLSNGRTTIVLVTAAGCESCNGLYPFISEYAVKWKVNIALFIKGSVEDIHEKIEDYRLSVSVFQYTDKIGASFKAPAFPYSYYVATDGKIYAKGSANREEQFAQLLEEGFSLENVMGKAS